MPANDISLTSRRSPVQIRVGSFLSSFTPNSNTILLYHLTAALTMQTKLWVILLVLFCALLGAVGQVFFKLGSATLKLDAYSLLTNWKVIIGLVLYGLATILFLIALRQGNLSILYPIIATSYIWVSIFSVYFLHESFSPFKWLGIGFIVLGVIFIVQ